MCLLPADAGAVPYDLLRPPLLGADERRRLAAAARAFSQAASSLASEYLGTPVRLGLCACPHETAAAPASVWVLAAGLDHEHAPVWRLDLCLAAAVVDVMLGAASHRRPDPCKPLSRLESRLVARFCREVFSAFGATWPLRAACPDDWRCIRGGADVPGPCPTEWTPLVFQASCEGTSGLLDLYLPQSIARLPAAPRRKEAPPEGTTVQNAAVRGTRVPLSVTLGTWHTSLEGLLALKPGQTLPLDTPVDAALALSIGGAPRFNVKPGIHNGLVSVQVVGPVEE